METNDIKFLAEVMKKNGITKLDFENGGMKLVLERQADYEFTGNQAIRTVVAEGEMLPENSKETEPERFKEIKSPLVGVFYAAKAPGEPPYVEKGSKVKKGDILCLVEAMKIMNEIPAEADGTIEEVCVLNGQIVEYGQTLFKIS